MIGAIFKSVNIKIMGPKSAQPRSKVREKGLYTLVLICSCPLYFHHHC